MSIVDNNNKTDINDWKIVSSLGSSYKEFDKEHKNDIHKLQIAQDKGNLDDIMLLNTSISWAKTINKGIDELKHVPKTAKNEKIVSETIKDLKNALKNLNKITPQGKSTPVNSSSRILQSMRNFMTGGKKPIAPVDKPVCDTICEMSPDNRYNIKDMVKNLTADNRDQFKCCVKNLFLDDTFINVNTKSVISYLDSVDTLIIYYNTRKEFIMNNMLERSRKQITSIELLPRQNADISSIYIPFDVMSIFPALTSMNGVYTSNFKYMFKFVTDATLWLPNQNQSGYFDNNEQRIIQFLDLPNIKNLALYKKLVPDAALTSVYNLYISNTPQLETFEDSFNIIYDSIRIYNAPKLKYMQNKLHANKIDMKNINVDTLDLTVNKSLILSNFRMLKTLNVQLNEPNIGVKITGVPKLETLTINGQLNLGNSNKNIMFDNSTMNNLRTFIVEGKVLATNSKIIDNFIYEIIKNNKLLTHININGTSITGKNLYNQYKISFRPSEETILNEVNKAF